MKSFLQKTIFPIQYILLIFSYYGNKIFYIKKVNWIVGVHEMGKYIYLIKSVLEDSYSVSFHKNKFYSIEYDFIINISNKYIAYIYKIIIGPLLLGYLANKSDKFFYLWSTGFLIDREFEFKFLKSKDKKIVCMFLGSDSRSPQLMLEFYKKQKLNGFIEYVGVQHPYYLSDEYNIEKKKIAESADKYSDVIFNAAVDQMSYIKSKQYFPPNFVDNIFFNYTPLKFDEQIIKILHAPSNPFVKGTPLVRAAIKKLKVKGYNFEYIELQNIPNKVVLEHLKSSHIVLNQFYAFVPGMFGIEAMASHCAVLMSADPRIETGLPQDGKDAWMITRDWEIYDNLKYLLDNPSRIKYFADNAYEFASEHYTYEVASDYINKVLKDNGVYD